MRNHLKANEMPILPNKFSKIQKDFLIGSLLGDGSIHRKYSKVNKYYYNPIFSLLRKTSDIEYLMWGFNIIKDFCLSPPHNNSYVDSRTNKEYYSAAFATRRSELFVSWYDEWYGGGPKIVPKNLKLNPFIMAIWFCDDGCITMPMCPYRMNLKLSTHGFTKTDNEFLCDMLDKRYDEKFCIRKDEGNYFITGADNAARAFISEIDEFIPLSMERKKVWKAPEVRFYNDCPDRAILYQQNKGDNLSSVEFRILDSINEFGNMSRHDISPIVGLTTSSISRYVLQFIDKKYITMCKYTKDITHYYSITKIGKSVLEKMRNKLY